MILEESEPRFVILDYQTYQKLSGQKSSMTKLAKKILVTGGAGYIGSHAGRALVDRGHEVTTLDNLSTGFEEFAQGKLIKGDLSDRNFLDKVFAENKFDAVMHFAASVAVEESVKDPLKYYQNNVINSVNLLEAAVKHGVKKFVFSSTAAVYSEKAEIPITEKSAVVPTSPYAETKYTFEKILKAFAISHGVKSIILRYFNASGASLDQTLGLAHPEPSHLIPSIFNVALGRKDQLTIFGNNYNTQDGTAIRDYVHVLDLARAHVAALDYFEKSKGAACEIFNVGSGRGYSVMEVINAACEVTGKMIKFEVGPRREGDKEKIYADATKIQNAMNFICQYSDLPTILKTHWAFHKKRFGG